jgi:hypothetical protein
MAKAKEKEETALVVPPQNTAIQLPDYGDDYGKGFEHQDKSDYVIPFIVLLQSMSPLVKDEKAKAGQWYNTVTEEIYDRDEGFLFIGGTTRHNYAEWTPRDDGGGFHGHRECDDPIVLKAVKEAKRFGRNLFDATEIDKDGKEKIAKHQLTETYYVYGAGVSELSGQVSMAVIANKSTMIRPYRTWMSRLADFKIEVERNGKKEKLPAPMYSHLTRVTSKRVEKKGNDYYIPVYSSADLRGLAYSLLEKEDERFQTAKQCMMLVDAGKAEADPTKAEKAAGADDEIPF